VRLPVLISASLFGATALCQSSQRRQPSAIVSANNVVMRTLGVTGQRIVM